MKRKIAIAMASIMAVSPIAVFGASYNYRSRSVESVPEKTLLVEQSMYNQGLQNLEKSVSGVNAKANDINYMAAGTDLVIELRDKVQVGDTFQVVLTNAEWNFQNAPSFSNVNDFRFNNGATDKNGNLIIVGNATSNGSLAPNFASDLAKFAATAKSGAGSSKVASDKLFNTAAFWGGNTQVANYDVRNGIFDGTRTYYRFPAGTGINTTVQADLGDLAYELTVSPGDNRVATITVKQTPQEKYNDKIIRIPLVVRTTGSGEIKATIDARNTTLSSGAVTIASLGGSSISASIKDQVVSKYSFLLEKVKLTEKYTGTFKSDGPVAIVEAPYGYYWADPTLSTSKNSNGDPIYPHVMLEGMTYGANKLDDIDNSVTKVLSLYKDANGKEDRRKLVIDFGAGNLNPSTTFAGSIYLDKVLLTAEDYAPYDQDITLTVKKPDNNYKTGTSDFDDVTVVVGQRKDWGITLTNIDDPSKFVLVNGRYAFDEATSIVSDGKNNWDTLSALTTDNFDRDHKTAKIKVQENVTNSWWAGRETSFTLSDGVKFIRVKVEGLDNINSKIDMSYIPHKGRDAYSSLDAGKFTLFNLDVTKDKKAKFEMTSWVSVEPGTQGDISMYVNAVTDSDKSVVPSIKIAKAVSPITLTTETRDVIIGKQFQKVADFTITETAAGMLEKDKNVTIKIDDEISGSDGIAIAPDFVVETNGTDSNINISKPVAKGGTISFVIERESYAKPASIKFSNVYVKVDRTVPESNNRPYKIVVTGNSIAGNYYGNNGLSNTSTYEPVFGVQGLGANYINVVTPANPTDAALANMVKVTIGSDKVLVGRNTPTTLQMDTAAYVSTTGATMVPVRFVSQALGIPDNQIIWDADKSTVTILAPAKTIQFKVGSSDMTVNGATYTIYSVDTPPVKVMPEIKDSRIFLPFRALGDALGVSVTWDEATKSAIFNYEAGASTADSAAKAVTE